MMRKTPPRSSHASANSPNHHHHHSHHYAVSPRTTCLLVIVSAVPAFFLGTVVTLWSGLVDLECSVGNRNDNILQVRTHPNDKILAEQDFIQQQERRAQASNCSASTSQLFPAASMSRFAAGMARVTKESFVEHLDLGVPIDLSQPGYSDVLLLYQRAETLPESARTSTTEPVPLLDMPAALEECDFVNVVLTDHTKSRRQCTAIVPQYESYHIQKWMRIDQATGDLVKRDTDGKTTTTTGQLELVSRGRQSNGKDQFAPPTLEDTRQSWHMMQNYFNNLNDVLAELKAVLEQIAVDNTVIVMVCNFGQSELLMNFVCSAKSRGFELDNVIVFTTDQETTDLATSLGLTAYFDQRNFGDIPTQAARRYGDSKFVAMMMAKVICVQLVSMLGYDFLFQDVDIVWFKNPLTYFSDASGPAHEYDIFFQDDGGHSVRYAPYSANSGFYFVRHNDRTRHFLTSLLMACDLVLATNSHQQALIALLAEHVSLYGLKAKVLSRDEEEFPGGYQFHMKSGKYMKNFFAGKVHPYIFHMSWTMNKDNKLLFFKQMGEWYTQAKCIGKKVADIKAQDITSTCCSAEPLISCHYRDKPSKLPCKDSPTIDKGKKSFW